MQEPLEKNGAATEEKKDTTCDTLNGQQDVHATASESVQSGDMCDNSAVTDALAACMTELESYKQRFLRIRADFDNLSRRVEKERTQFVSVGQRAVLFDILAIVDDFDRALQEKSAAQASEGVSDKTQEREAWLTGFALIRSGLYKMLATYGVRPMTAQQYAAFDPQLHEAILRVASEAHKSGEIVQIFIAGFMINDQVLRPAQVSVAQ